MFPKHKEEPRLGVRGHTQTGGRRPLAGGPTREIPSATTGLRTWREKCGLCTARGGDVGCAQLQPSSKIEREGCRAFK